MGLPRGLDRGVREAAYHGALHFAHQDLPPCGLGGRYSRACDGARCLSRSAPPQLALLPRDSRDRLAHVLPRRMHALA